MRLHRAALLVVALLALAAAPATIAKPAKKTSVYTLPADAGNPEGIDWDKRSRAFYVTEANPGSDGDGGGVYRGTLGDPTLELFLPATPARPAAIGIKAHRGRLYIAGGGAGAVEVYDIATKAFVARYQLCSGGCFVNDLTVARNGDVYATESLQAPQVIYRIRNGVVQPINVTPPVTPEPGFNDNGIAAAGNGRYVVFVQSNTGKLFRLATRSMATREIPVRGGPLTNGDGLVLKGRTLYVVRNQDQLIAKVRLDGRFRRGRVVRQVTNATFEDPTTASLVGNRLLVVNSDFFPPPQGPPYTVSSIKRP